MRCVTPLRMIEFIQSAKVGNFMEISLEGKVAVVTGASSGIGLAITERISNAAHWAWLLYFAERKYPRNSRRLKSAMPGRLVIVQGDVAEEQTSIEFTKTAVERFGRLDVLVSQCGGQHRQATSFAFA